MTPAEAKTWAEGVGPGWRQLVIAALLASKATGVSQVKEKFGGLRIYADTADDKGQDLILAAEDMSYFICEDCGTTDDVETKGGWIRTLCSQCREKR